MNYVEIPLTQGKVAKVDKEDAEWISQYKWYAHKNYTSWYALRKQNYKTVRMHREVMCAPEGTLIDHINGNGLDNRKVNLRFCTHKQNSRNMKKTRFPTSSKYKGVYWKKHVGRWYSQIGVDNKNKHLGYFESEIEAAIAYNEAAIKYFGEFAKLNEI